MSSSVTESISLNMSHPTLVNEVDDQPSKIWSISASDSSTGAGSQADLAISRALNQDIGQIITAVTAQNSTGVHAIELVSVAMIDAQWQALKQDGLPLVIKLGWLPPSDEFRTWLLQQLQDFDGLVVWDPVKSATSQQGSGLTPVTGEFWQTLLPLISVVTPNQAELEWLTQYALADDCSDQQRCQWLQQQGVKTIVVTGTDRGTEKGTEKATDSPASADHKPHQFQDGVIDNHAQYVHTRVWHTPDQRCPEEVLAPTFSMWQERQPTNAHGSGCHFSTAIAVYLAKGRRRYDALMHAALAAASSVKSAHHRLSGYPICKASIGAITQPQDWPLISDWDVFPNAGHRVRLEPTKLGLYALTDNIPHLKQLLALGVDTIQWRVKKQSADFREQTELAQTLCRQAGVAFWLNDYWQLGIELNVDGVHLGQEDCCDADLETLRQQGIATGISTHTDWEVARARCFNPSYIAFGPIHPPLSKTLKYPPVGYQRLAAYVTANSDLPQTCIGGITSENIAAVAATGIESAAIVTALQPGPEQTTEHQQLAHHFLQK